MRNILTFVLTLIFCICFNSYAQEKAKSIDLDNLTLIVKYLMDNHVLESEDSVLINVEGFSLAEMEGSITSRTEMGVTFVYTYEDNEGGVNDVLLSALRPGDSGQHWMDFTTSPKGGATYSGMILLRTLDNGFSPVDIHYVKRND